MNFATKEKLEIVIGAEKPRFRNLAGGFFRRLRRRKPSELFPIIDHQEVGGLPGVALRGEVEFDSGRVHHSIRPSLMRGPHSPFDSYDLRSSTK